jgi:hypothetical protein
VESLTRVDIVGTGLSSYAAHIFHQELRRVLAEVGHSTPAATWQRISQQLLRPEHPYTLHQLMYYSTFRTWDPAVHGPPPSWIPNLGSARLTNLGQLLESKGVELLGSQYANPIDSYSAFQRWSVQHPEVCLSAKSDAQLWWYLILIKQISSSKIVDREFYVALHFSCPF